MHRHFGRHRHGHFHGHEPFRGASYNDECDRPRYAAGHHRRGGFGRFGFAFLAFILDTLVPIKPP